MTPQFGTARKPAKPAGKRYLTFKDLPTKGINYSVTHLRRMWGDGRFPPPIHLSPRKLAWAESVIDAWIASKMEAA
jgi:predicted DNA-binding transcriptional regulator AlpA